MREFGEDCLSPAGASSAAAALYEKRREPEGLASGVAFFWFLFLAKQEKELGRRDELPASLNGLQQTDMLMWFHAPAAQ